MNNDEFIKFIEDIIVEHTQDQPQLGCWTHLAQHYNVSYTTGWLQPCDIVLFGPSKQKLSKQHKLDRQSDISQTLQRTCQQFSDALNAVSNSAVKRTWNRIG